MCGENFICRVFGHKRTYNEFTGEYLTKLGQLGYYIKVPLFELNWRTHCPRCGEPLLEPDDPRVAE